ncbi:MAG: hypothetical protein FJW64_13455 [Actinobacteria bacterium]|nr:hypothetical protein [Actinomycetota bacterium]
MTPRGLSTKVHRGATPIHPSCRTVNVDRPA